MLVEKYGWTIQKSLFAKTNQESTFSHTRENSKMFNAISKYFSFFKPPASWIAHMTRDFLTCYSCSYYSSMLRWSFLIPIWYSLILIQLQNTVWKVSKYGVFSGLYFPIFGLYSALRIRSEYGKIRARKTPYLNTFHPVKVSQPSIYV